MMWSPIEGNTSLGLTRIERRKRAEEQVEGWIIAKGLNPRPGMGKEKLILATDSSMKPANVKMRERRTVTAACITSGGKEVGTLVDDNSAVAMHGELLGTIMALVQTRLEVPKEALILTDYLNVVKKIQEFQEKGNMVEGSWYRWICNLWKEVESIGSRLEIQHVRAHVNIQTASTYELLNHRADQVANKARRLRTLNYSE
jgi:ribonuclease HI